MAIIIEVTLFGMLALWLHGLKKQQGPVRYTLYQQYAFYAFARGIPFFMVENKSIALVALLLMDLVFYLILVQWYQEQDPVANGELPFIYAVTPLSVLWALSSNLFKAAVFPVLTILLICFEQYANKQRFVKWIFNKTYPAYVVFSLGSALVCLAKELGQSFSWDTSSTDNSPVLLTIALIVMLAGLLYGILLACDRIVPSKSKLRGWFQGNSNESDVPELSCHKKPTLQSLLLLAGIMCIYTFLVFNKIGDTNFPNSALRVSADDENTSIIYLNVGGRKLSDLYFCLGDKKAFITLFTSNDETESWDQQDDNVEYISYYNWERPSSLPNENINWIALYSHNGPYTIQEMVLLDENGQTFLPLNAEQYPELFDEQNTFPSELLYYYRTMFDEVYYATTANEIINHESIFENTHPPLGKNLMAFTISKLGNNPYGWRFTEAVCGILSIPFVFGIAFLLIRKEKYALMAAILHCTEFMHLTLSRICTIDIIVALFVLAMFFFMLMFIENFNGKNREGWGWLLPCGISMSLAVSTKFTGFYGAIGLAVMFFYSLFRKIGTDYRKWDSKYLATLAGLCILCFVLLPFGIFTLSYFTYAWCKTETRGLIEIMCSNFKDMINYHRSIKEPHPYASEWYTWPLDITPLLDAYTVLSDEKKSLVVTLGNPMIYFVGLLSIAPLFMMAVLDRDDKAKLVLIMYLCMFVPWFFVHRIVFIYQYYISGTILTVMLPYTISKMTDKKARNIIGWALPVCCVVLLLWFYPMLTGIPATSDYLKELCFFPDLWRLWI